MPTNKEKLAILENILADGVDGALERYAQALKTINIFKTYTAMNPPPMPTEPPNMVNQTPLGQNEGALPPMGDNGLGTPVQA